MSNDEPASSGTPLVGGPTPDVIEAGPNNNESASDNPPLLPVPMSKSSLGQTKFENLRACIIADLCLNPTIIEQKQNRTKDFWFPFFQKLFFGTEAPLRCYKPWTTREASKTKELVFNVLEVENGIFEKAVMENRNPTEVSMHARTMWRTKVEYDIQCNKALQEKKDKKAERKRKNEENERDMGLRNEERGVDTPSNVAHKEGDSLSRAAALLGRPTNSPHGGDDAASTQPPAQKKHRGKKDKEGDLAKRCAAGSAGKCSKYKLGKDDETPTTHRYKDNQDPIDGLINGLKESETEHVKSMKNLWKYINSCTDLSEAGKKQRMKTNYLNQLHMLYATEQIVHDLGGDVSWFRALEAEMKKEIMEVDYYSISSGSDSSLSSDEESSSSDGDKKLPSK